ncbi:TIGR03936 family radical SAM-associated protein [Actinacidiphila sp. ITFR-21]|uniref:TIGR03936 family radical SAM-associated protein n=1 Tax=Actinacidiphila sp. ITFR-21 TaxID=3075199 RepID=UPI00288A0A2A|nr:TIGR03936 family radical SAM-associated protein [Streptomyces sp. ITFR-21]WNI15483.1 TIGR03936 family radical SAM-associated protein [Streptomyces sp. ITFR-21]
MQRIRLRYTKRGRLRFTSHRDFQRAFERALRRADVPMAYSAGFTPHPKVSYANAAPTGVGSEAEYLEIGLARTCDPEPLRRLLDESLPAGLDVIEAVEAHTAGLAERLEASVWQVRLDGVTPQDARRAVAAFLAADTVEVQRGFKNGVRSFDCRAAVTRFEVVGADGVDDTAGPDPREVADLLETDTNRTGAGPDRPQDSACAILRLVVRHLTPAVRPDDVLSGLQVTAGLAPPVPAAVTRLAQGPLAEGSGTVTDPLAPDRDAVAVPAGSA